MTFENILKIFRSTKHCGKLNKTQCIGVSDRMKFLSGFSFSANAIKHSSITVEHITYTPWVVYGSREQPVKSTIENESGEPNEQRPDEKSFIHFWFACFVCIVLCGCRKGNGRWESKRANCDLCADAFQEISMVCEWFHFISSGRVKCQASQGISIIVIKHYHLALLLISVDTFSGDFFPSFSSSSVDAETRKKIIKSAKHAPLSVSWKIVQKYAFTLHSHKTDDIDTAQGIRTVRRF